MLDMNIKDGRVVTPSGVGKWDVGVLGERIAVVTLPVVLTHTTIDGTGMIDVPSRVGPHTHAVSNVQPGGVRKASPPE